MDLQIKRCKYCGHTYTYQASGNGCFSPTNDDTYCPRCKEIINRALKNEVPEEDILIKRPIEIKNLSEDILEIMLELKRESKKDSILPQPVMNVNLDYDNIEYYYINKKKYYICYNNDEEQKKHYYIDKEYNEKTYIVGDDYLHFNTKSTYGKGVNFLRYFTNTMKNIKIEENKIPKPSDKVFYCDFDENWKWEVVSNIDKNIKENDRD